MPEIGRKSYGCAVKIPKISIFHIFWPERVHVDFHFVRQNSTFSCGYSKSSKSQLSLNIYIAGHIPYRKKVIPLWNFDIPLLLTFVLNFHFLISISVFDFDFDFQKLISLFLISISISISDSLISRFRFRIR